MSGCANQSVPAIQKENTPNAPKKIEKTTAPAPVVEVSVTESVDQTNSDTAAAVVMSAPKDEPEEQEEQDNFNGKYLNKIEASELLRRGIKAEIVAVGARYFDFKDEDGTLYRIETPIKPKLIERYVNEYGYSDERIRTGFEPGMKGTLKSSSPPQDYMGVGPGPIIGVTPEASDGVMMQEVMPLFTLTTPAVKGPNDQAIREEMDYDPSSRDSSVKKRWFEIFRGLTKGVIWTIFEQSNRYFTMVDKREWDRYTPGHIFSLMQQFEYLVPIPDRLLSGRTPKILSDEEKRKNRYVIHDYSFAENTVRVLVPTYLEFERAIVLAPMKNEDQEIGYSSINKSLSDAEMADGEKFTWNVPVKVNIFINDLEYPLYMPSQAIIDINGKFFKLPK